MRSEKEILQKIHEARKAIAEDIRLKDYRNAQDWSTWIEALDWILEE